MLVSRNGKNPLSKKKKKGLPFKACIQNQGKNHSKLLQDESIYSGIWKQSKLLITRS